MTTVDVCIPWRPAPDRMAAYARVRVFWNHFGFDPILGDSPKSKPFNLARARNAAVRQSTADVVIVADADTIPDIGAVQQAIDIAGSESVVVWPFDKYRHLPGDAAFASDLLTIAPEREYKGSVGGLFVVARDTYWSLGGQDERFESRWGYDDSAFRCVAATLAGIRRLPGIVYSFNHAADRDMTDDNPNKHRFALYRFADGKPDVMRELIKK